MPAKKQEEVSSNEKTTANVGKRTAQVGSTLSHHRLVEFLFLKF